MDLARVTMVAAVAQNGVIAVGDHIPWRVKGEQQFFRTVTLGNWCIVGRKTFELMGKLEGRKFAVISKKRIHSNDPEVLYFESPEQAILALSALTSHIMVIGGGQIYERTIDYCDNIILSTIQIDAPVQEDSIFLPKIKREDYKRIYNKLIESNINYRIGIYERKD